MNVFSGYLYQIAMLLFICGAAALLFSAVSEAARLCSGKRNETPEETPAKIKVLCSAGFIFVVTAYLLYMLSTI